MVKVWSLRSDSVHLVRSLCVRHRPLSLMVVCNLLLVSIENGDLLAFDLSCFRLVRSGPLHSQGNVLVIDFIIAPLRPPLNLLPVPDELKQVYIERRHR